MMKTANIRLLFAVAAVLFLLPRAGAQSMGRPIATVHGQIDNTRLVTLHNNTRPEANALNDRGRVSDDFALPHMLLQLKISPEREAAMNKFIAELNDRNSPNYHKWLTPAQFAENFGVAKPDVDAVTDWLQSHGFTINGVQASGRVIDFSGKAGQVHTAFHTEIHNLEVDGRAHFGNMSDPQIPAALAPAIEGVVSLHNFHPRTMHSERAKFTFNTANGTFHALVPGDIATIYNFSPLFNAGISGKGQSIMVVEDTYLFSTTDWTVFRKTFGLSRPFPFATLSQVSPQGAVTCTNPGFQGSPSDPGYGDDGEAAIDVEWATAAAPNAAIILAACEDTTAFGGLIALQNTLNGPAANLPSVVSISYGESESVNGAASNAAFNATYAQAAAEGVSIFVSSGDEDAASSDGGNPATHGITISGFASSPFDVAVGGTDFGYTALGVDPATYWSATNSNTFSSALSYIQEVPWNDSCGGALVAAFLGISPLGLCNNPAVTNPSGSLNFTLNSIGGSGGPSGCATGAASTRGIVSGTCAGYPKPAYQIGLLGNPADGVRDIPDVSLFASNGFWDAYYVTCWSNPDPNVGGGGSCNGNPATWPGFGGTSVSSPIMASIQALINQKTGSRWGNPNPIYYNLANTEFTTGGGAASCNSTTVNKTSNTCIFYDVTQGDIVGACKARLGVLHNCFTGGNTIGLISTSNTVLQPAFSTTTGWDFATGIGTVNAFNLVMNWP